MTLALADAKVKPSLKLNGNGTVYNADGIRINSVATSQYRSDCVTNQYVEG